MSAAAPRWGFATHVAPAIVYVVAVFVGGSLGRSSVHDLPFMSRDKLLHFLAFGAMLFLVQRAVRFERPNRTLSWRLVLSAVICCALGGLLELYQAALPHRSAELADWFADCLGVVAASGVVFVVGRL